MIYKVTEELRAAMEGMLEPEEVEETARRRPRCKRDSSRPRESARSPAASVTDGKVTRGASVRLVRDGTVV